MYYRYGVYFEKLENLIVSITNVPLNIVDETTESYEFKREAKEKINRYISHLDISQKKDLCIDYKEIV